MRPLTEKQARSCEHANTKRCRCLCSGALHGAGRFAADAPRREFEVLSETDAHRLTRRRENGHAAGEGAP